jgi:hypothetical protein
MTINAAHAEQALLCEFCEIRGFCVLVDKGQTAENAERAEHNSLCDLCTDGG